MSDWIIIPSDELAHSGTKGMEWKKHKYVSKEAKGGKTRYKYKDEDGNVTKTEDLSEDDISDMVWNDGSLLELANYGINYLGGGKKYAQWAFLSGRNISEDKSKSSNDEWLEKTRKEQERIQKEYGAGLNAYLTEKDRKKAKKK